MKRDSGIGSDIGVLDFDRSSGMAVKNISGLWNLGGKESESGVRVSGEQTRKRRLSGFWSVFRK